MGGEFREKGSIFSPSYMIVLDNHEHIIPKFDDLKMWAMENLSHRVPDIKQFELER